MSAVRGPNAHGEKGDAKRAASQSDLGLWQPEGGEVSVSGTIEKVLFRSEDERFTVATLKPPKANPIVITGDLGLCSPGEEVLVAGLWSVHPKYGRRLEVKRFSSKVPQTLEGLRRFLASGLIPGIGPRRAAQIVDRFKEETIAVLDAGAKRLVEIPGIGPKTLERVSEAWRRYRGLRELLVFLQGYGIGIGRAMQVFKEYGSSAAGVLASNPYRLADDIKGIGFKTADQIAAKLGIGPADPERLKAGILYLLARAREKGHTFLPKNSLLQAAAQLLQVDQAKINEAFETLRQKQEIICDDLQDGLAVFLPQLWAYEVSVAEEILRIMRGPRAFDIDGSVERLLRSGSRQDAGLSEEQAAAIRKALTSKVLVITGGPGTGKTFLIGRLVKICRQEGIRIGLCAPTGRAAKRLSEATGFEAKTVHRLLEYNAFERRFRYDQQRRLPLDILVVDEASMLDVWLMSRLLLALPETCTLVVVGDADQLPSVGPGAVLNQIISSKAVDVAKLSHIFRQRNEEASPNLIVLNAHRINQGLAPIFPRRSASGPGQFYFISRQAPQDAMKTVVEVATQRIPRRFRLDPLRQVQVITPMHKGQVGTITLNQELQKALNPSGTPFQIAGRVFRVGDKVIQTKNNYDKEVFNGDIGVIDRIDKLAQRVIVDFGDRKVPYTPLEIGELQLAYAISVHKSQGSEYDAVVLPLLTQHYMLLQRNLIYTAVTRARRLVVMVGSKKALFMAIGNNRTSRRYTLLAKRLSGLASHSTARSARPQERPENS